MLVWESSASAIVHRSAISMCYIYLDITQTKYLHQGSELSTHTDNQNNETTEKKSILQNFSVVWVNAVPMNHASSLFLCRCVSVFFVQMRETVMWSLSLLSKTAPACRIWDSKWISIILESWEKENGHNKLIYIHLIQHIVSVILTHSAICCLFFGS